MLWGNIAHLTRFMSKLRGGSQPILAEASDGLLYVVKFIDNLQGPNLLFNEAVGSELYRACGLPTPNWTPLLATQPFIEENPGMWMQTADRCIRPNSGLCFGSQFHNGKGRKLLEILPGNSFLRVRDRANFWLAWIIDICAEHADNRQALFLQSAIGELEARFVDHGHLFGGPNGDESPRILKSKYLDPRIYPSVSFQQLLDFQRVALAMDPERIWRTAANLPDEWKTESALRRCGQCLERVSSSNYLRNVLDMICEVQQRAGQFVGTGDFPSGRQPALSVLRTGVPGAESDQFWDDHPACA